MNIKSEIKNYTNSFACRVQRKALKMDIYIGNLNYRVRESDLQQVLEEYGTVESVKLIIDRDTRRSKGFAFAELPNENEARNAIEELNGAEYEGRQMVVKEATPRR